MNLDPVLDESESEGVDNVPDINKDMPCMVKLVVDDNHLGYWRKLWICHLENTVAKLSEMQFIGTQGSIQQNTERDCQGRKRKRERMIGSDKNGDDYDGDGADDDDDDDTVQTVGIEHSNHSSTHKGRHEDGNKNTKDYFSFKYYQDVPVIYLLREVLGLVLKEKEEHTHSLSISTMRLEYDKAKVD